MGLLLRYVYLGHSIPFQYHNLLHAHSHIALLGWLYMILFALWVYHYLDFDKKIRKLFWITQATVIGMMISFPLQGYGLYSIIFSSSHIICSYYFAYLIWTQALTQQPLEKFLLRLSSIFLVLSTFAIWALPIVIKIYGKQTPQYFLCIQFYLHFFFNGWFIIGSFALLIRYVKIKRLSIIYSSLLLFVLSILLGFSLLIYWYFPYQIFYVLYVLSTFLQLISFILICSGLIPNTIFKKPAAKLLKFALICFVIKLIQQIFLTIPAITQLAFQIRSLYIGYIHLFMLGIISSICLAIFFQNTGSAYNKKLEHWSINLFIFSIAFSEILIFISGISSWLNLSITSYPLMMFLSSILLVISIILLFISIRAKPKYL